MAYEVKKKLYGLDEERRPLGASLAEATANAAQTSAPAPKTGTTGRFVNFGRYLNANRDVAAREGGKVADKVEQAGQGAEAAVKGYEKTGVAGLGGSGAQIQNVRASSSPAPSPQSFEGVNAQVQQANSQLNMARGGVPQQAALAGGSAFNAAVTRAPVGARLHNAGQRYAGLSKMLGTAQTNVLDANNARMAEGAKVQAANAEAEAAAKAQAQAEMDRQSKEKQQFAQEDADFDAYWRTGKVSNYYFGPDGAQQNHARAAVDQMYGPGTYDRIRNALVRRHAVAAGFADGRIV